MSLCLSPGMAAGCMSDDNKQKANATATSSLHLDFRRGTKEKRKRLRFVQALSLPPSSANYPFRHSSLFVSAESAAAADDDDDEEEGMN